MEYYMLRQVEQLKTIYDLLKDCHCPQAEEVKKIIVANIRVLELLMGTEFKP